MAVGGHRVRQRPTSPGSTGWSSSRRDSSTWRPSFKGYRTPSLGEQSAKTSISRSCASAQRPRSSRVTSVTTLEGADSDGPVAAHRGPASRGSLPPRAPRPLQGEDVRTAPHNHDSAPKPGRINVSTGTGQVHPHTPWQHGSDGLLRQYWPKGTDFSTVTEAELDAVADEPNERPRKRLALANPPSASRSCCCNDPSKSAVCGTERTHDGSRDSTEAAAAPSATGPWAPGGRRPTRPRADLRC